MRERSLKIALAASIVLNLFALGAAGGGVAMWVNMNHAAAAARRRPLMAAADALPPADQARFRTAIRATLRDARPLQRTARESRWAAADLFVQPTFDAAKVSAALGRARDADFTLRTRLETAMVDFSKDLPQTERATIARQLARRGPLRHPQTLQGR